MSVDGKNIVITGATSGIGEAGARALAKAGARIVITARSRDKGEATIAALKAINPKQDHKAYYADLSKLSEMKRAGAEIAANEPVIDVLVNNAGAVYTKREETVDGLERMFAINHMSYFVLTNALLEKLKAAPGARIISTSSGAHRMGGPLDFDDLQTRRKFSAGLAYGRSKLCNILFTRELAKRTQSTGVISVSFHPGLVGSNLATNNGPLINLIVSASKALGLSISNEAGADTLVWLATAPVNALANGGYYYKRKPGALAAFAQDDAAAARLWEESARIAA